MGVFRLSTKPKQFDSLVCAISRSKQRKKFGLVVCGLNQKEKKLYVGYIFEWDRNELKKIVKKIKEITDYFECSHTIIDQSSGEHFIDLLKKQSIHIKVITTKKDMDDPLDIDRLEVMDKVEMAQLFLTLKNENQIVFPEESKYLPLLENQLSLFTEKITEAGTVDYYAPGNEPDNLIKALMLCAFSYRKQLTEECDISHVGGSLYAHSRGLSRHALEHQYDINYAFGYP